MIEKLIKNAVFKNASWLIVGKVTQMVISLVVGVLTARYLGPSNYGLINYATAYTAFFMSFCTLGINSVLVKEFVEHPHKEGEIIGSVLLMKGAASFLSAGVIILLVAVLDADEPTTIAVTALCSLGLLFRIFETFHYWFQSKLQSKVSAMVTLAAYALTSAYKVCLLILGKSVEWFAFATVLDYVLVGVFLLYSYQKYGGRKLSFSLQTGRGMFRQSVHFILPGLMVSIYGYADKFMLKQMLSETEVGYYATATALCGMWCFVLTAIIDSMTPMIMEAHKTDRILYEKRNRQLYGIVFYVSVVVSCLFCVFGEFVIELLYGSAFSPAAKPLRVITWYTAFSYLGVARNAWIVCENKQRYLKYIYVSAAVSNVLLNLVLIPLWGAIGAALASLMTQIATTMLLPFFVKDIRRNSVLMIEGICLKNVR